MTADQPISTWYALFKPGKVPGSGDFLASRLGVTTEGPLQTSPDNIRAVHVFSTRQCAEDFLSNNPKIQGFDIAPLSGAHCRTMLLEGQEHGLHQQVAFNAGAGTSKAFPIEEFVALMGGITLRHAEEA